MELDFQATNLDPLRFGVPRLYGDLAGFQTIDRDRYGQVHELDDAKDISDFTGSLNPSPSLNTYRIQSDRFL
jgi:hypothetical protein